MERRLALAAVALLLTIGSGRADGLPEGFVYLRDVEPTIAQDIKYHGPHNFIGRPITGYQAPECILSRRAADALAAVQRELRDSALSLKVYDCYRPQRAVDDFIAWSQVVTDQKMKWEFYPRVDKANFFKLGYVAAKSGHSRGSTVDVTLIPTPAPPSQEYTEDKPLVSCFAPYVQRFRDNSLDMGTAFDCMDELSHPHNPGISLVGRHNRLLLAALMGKQGFKPLPEEWWHYTLRDEPFPDTYFDFPVTAPATSEPKPEPKPEPNAEAAATVADP